MIYDSDNFNNEDSKEHKRSEEFLKLIKEYEQIVNVLQNIYNSWNDIIINSQDDEIVCRKIKENIIDDIILMYINNHQVLDKDIRNLILNLYLDIAKD